MAEHAEEGLLLDPEDEDVEDGWGEQVEAEIEDALKIHGPFSNQVCLFIYFLPLLRAHSCAQPAPAIPTHLQSEEAIRLLIEKIDEQLAALSLPPPVTLPRSLSPPSPIPSGRLPPRIVKRRLESLHETQRRKRRKDKQAAVTLDEYEAAIAASAGAFSVGGFSLSEAPMSSSAWTGPRQAVPDFAKLQSLTKEEALAIPGMVHVGWNGM